MTVHTLKLADVPFRAIAGGKKVIESRLYDEKRQAIRLGDEIQFINREKSEETVTGEVIGLLRYQTFRELFEHNDPSKFDGPSVDWLLNQISEFYSEENQQEDGVVGIEFKLK
ncbi:MAG TPA: ASCH domain-containing protein [Candidatus Saccharimonadales bacterium]